MRIADITRLAGADRKPRRIGRGPGSGCGKTSGRGHKGAGSRSGWKSRGLAEGGAMATFRRIPKRGFSNFKFRTEYVIVNVGDLEERFHPGDTVDVNALSKIGLVGRSCLPLKVLGHGDLKKKLVVHAAKFSASAQQKIEAAGGRIEVVGRLAGSSSQRGES